MPSDHFGREIDYLRISLIDHCNLRCVYCMPFSGMSFLRNDQLLTPAEIESIATVAVRAGFRKIRLTGGEPTLRPDLVEIVERVATIPGLADLALTTNGILLPRLAAPLAAAGLRRVNVHIDTLHPERLTRVMRLGSLAEIWNGILAAEEAGLDPIKLNAVVVRGYNDEDVAELAALTRTRSWHVRFIELMPLGVGEPASTAREAFVSSAETRGRLERALGPLRELPRRDPSDESRNYRFDGAAGVVGFISPVSEPYCGTCNRMRLTAAGRFHLCLLNDAELDVRAALRDGGPDAAERVLLRAIAGKPIGHDLARGRTIERREMYELGG